MPSAIIATDAHSEAEQLHRDIDAGYLLPTQWYGDPTLFKTELEAHPPALVALRDAHRRPAYRR